MSHLSPAELKPEQEGFLLYSISRSQTLNESWTLLSLSRGWRPTAGSPPLAASGGWHQAPLHSSDMSLTGRGRRGKEASAWGSAWDIAALSGTSSISSPKPPTLGSHSITDIYRPRKVIPGPEACWRFQDATVKILISARSKFKCKSRIWCRFYRSC